MFLKLKIRLYSVQGKKNTGEENLCEFGLNKDFSAVAKKYDL